MKIVLAHVWGAAREPRRLEAFFSPLYQTPPRRIASLATSLFAAGAFDSKVSLLAG